jgi:arylsulfatase A
MSSTTNDRARPVRLHPSAGLLAGLCAAALAPGALAQPTRTQPASPIPSSAAVATRPNIVLILADDLGAEAINAYGGEYHTPRIDELARQGVLFTNAHATPLCTPTRVRLLTGMESAKNYKAFGYLDPKARTIGHVMKEAGYATAIVGKWQLSGNGYDGLVGASPQGAGFEQSLLWQEKTLDEKGSRYWGPTLSTNGQNRINESGFGPDIQSAFALEFIEKNKDRPFFLYYPMVLPHAPWIPTPDSPNARTDKARFAGMVSYMDTLVGQVTDKLKALGLEKNTLVIFTSDNGTGRPITSYVGGHAIQGGKGRPAFTGTHVPLVASWPAGFPAGETRDGLFDMMDVLPTLASLAGAPADPKVVDGVDQAPIVRGEKPSARDWIFMHYAPVWVQEPARFVFDDKWKLYGDGRFVAIDKARGVETPIEQPKPGSPAAVRRASFQRVLDTMADGPLNQDRYPMCIGKPSLDLKLPAIRAGCARMTGAVE